MIRNIVFDVGKVLIGWSPEKSMDMTGFTAEEKQAVMKALFTDVSIWNEEDRGVKSREEMFDYLVSQAPEIGDLIRRFSEKGKNSKNPHFISFSGRIRIPSLWLILVKRKTFGRE